MAASDSRFEVKPTAGNHFAWLRTRMSIDRTLMVRHGVSELRDLFEGDVRFARALGTEV